MSPAGFLKMLASPLPWQHLYRRTLGRKHRFTGPAHWGILSTTVETFDPLSFDPQKMNLIPAPGGSTWADPFCRSRGDKSYLFMEDWPARSPCAHLSVVDLDSSGLPTSAPCPIIRSDTHYSYPCLFEYDGQLWMMPENSMSNRLQLYRCTEFPSRWIADRIVMQGVRYADPTVFEHDGSWWMFITFGTGYYGVNTNLFLFHSDNPVSGKWTSHPMNPVVSGFHRSRPAGRPFVSNGRLFRPSQNCLKCYGHGLRINEIHTLNTRKYKETTVREILPWADNILGIHHLDICGNVVVMDIHLKGTTHESSVR